MGKIFDFNGNTKDVKNMGWILKNWEKVHCIQWFDSDKPDVDGFFLAHCKDRLTFHSEFASFKVFLRWINRPIFKRVPIYFCQDVNNPITLTIGTKEYREYCAKHGNV